MSWQPDPDRLVFVTDFPDAKGSVQRLRFSQPQELLIAWRADEVPALLRTLDARVRAGCWAVGQLAYEAAAGFDPKLAASMQLDASASQPEPLAAFALFSGPDAMPDFESGAQSPPASGQVHAAPDWQLSEDAGQHGKAIGTIRSAIQDGEVYQVNHTLRVLAERGGLPLWQYHEALRARQLANYCAWLDWGGWQVLSASPELFFDWNRQTGQIATRPMKGTAPRGNTPEQDAEAARQLQASPKERAENVMIVDLLRNDLGRVAITGSVQTTALFQVEPYPTLWQMTSTVQAITRPEIDLPALMQALFPCGSITGAPKRMAMEKITLLEKGPRGVYCGAIGVMSPYRAVFNVAIRTVTALPDGCLRGGIGGGITLSSDAASEYAEAVLKARFLHTESLPLPDFELLETLLLHKGRYALLPWHLQRLQASARQWNWRPVSVAAIQHSLQQLAQAHASGRWRVRLLLSANGQVTTTATQLVEPSGATDWDSCQQLPADWLRHPDATSMTTQPVAVAPAPLPADLQPWICHKTSHRQHYDALTDAFPQAWDVLLHDDAGFALECTRGNIVLQTADGRWLTPAQQGQLLPGTFRQALLQRGLIREAVLPLCLLQRMLPGEQLWFINSVRGWVPLQLLPA